MDRREGLTEATKVYSIKCNSKFPKYSETCGHLETDLLSTEHMILEKSFPITYFT